MTTPKAFAFVPETMPDISFQEIRDRLEKNIAAAFILRTRRYLDHLTDIAPDDYQRAVRIEAEIAEHLRQVGRATS